MRTKREGKVMEKRWEIHGIIQTCSTVGLSSQGTASSKFNEELTREALVPVSGCVWVFVCLCVCRQDWRSPWINCVCLIQLSLLLGWGATEREPELWIGLPSGDTDWQLTGWHRGRGVRRGNSEKVTQRCTLKIQVTKSWKEKKVIDLHSVCVCVCDFQLSL